MKDSELKAEKQNAAIKSELEQLLKANGSSEDDAKKLALSITSGESRSASDDQMLQEAIKRAGTLTSALVGGKTAGDIKNIEQYSSPEEFAKVQGDISADKAGDAIAKSKALRTTNSDGSAILDSEGDLTSAGLAAKERPEQNKLGEMMGKASQYSNEEGLRNKISKAINQVPKEDRLGVAFSMQDKGLLTEMPKFNQDGKVDESSLKFNSASRVARAFGEAEGERLTDKMGGMVFGDYSFGIEGNNVSASKRNTTDISSGTMEVVQDGVKFNITDTATIKALEKAKGDKDKTKQILTNFENTRFTSNVVNDVAMMTAGDGTKVVPNEDNDGTTPFSPSDASTLTGGTIAAATGFGTVVGADKKYNNGRGTKLVKDGMSNLYNNTLNKLGKERVKGGDGKWHNPNEEVKSFDSQGKEHWGTYEDVSKNPTITHVGFDKNGIATFGTEETLQKMGIDNIQEKSIFDKSSGFPRESTTAQTKNPTTKTTEPIKNPTTNGLDEIKTYKDQPKSQSGLATSSNPTTTPNDLNDITQPPKSSSKDIITQSGTETMTPKEILEEQKSASQANKVAQENTSKYLFIIFKNIMHTLL